MRRDMLNNRIISASSLIRKLLLAWLCAATVEYLLLPGIFISLQSLDGLAQMSLLRVAIFTAAFFLVLMLVNKPRMERWAMVIAFVVLAIVSLLHSFSLPFLFCDLLILGSLVSYAVRGWNGTEPQVSTVQPDFRLWKWVTAALAFGFFLFVSIWTVCRVYSFSTPTFDFGIFSQMFYSMKTTGLPMTTVERDGLLSHFYVHISPIYYVLLPFYCLAPTPATLQVLQAAVLASAVIPLWLIGKQHNLSPVLRALLCALLLFYPAYSGGTSYDIHENAFLTPLILWLMYAMTKKHLLLSAIFGILVLLVKEDAAVYCAVIALYFLLNGLLRKDRWYISTSLFLGTLSVLWFLAVTGFLANVGDGVMTYRYQNFMYDNSGSLLSVILSVVMCPMKAVWECVDTEKLTFIAQTLLPLIGIPFITRRYERYILLIPYILINLMSDYQYQHDIFFQYTYGSTACLFYMTAVNLADIKIELKRAAALLAALIVSAGCFAHYVVPKASTYPKRYITSRSYYDAVRETLSSVPDNATVSATTFYTTYLSQREILYDVQYASLEHILSTEYVVAAVQYQNAYKRYATNGEDGFENFIFLLECSGYELYTQVEDVLVIYRKA